MVITLRCLGDGFYVVEAGQDTLDLGIEDLALGSHLQAPATPDEDGEAKLVLKIGDHPTDGRLRDAELVGSFRHGSRLDDCAERIEPIQLHRSAQRIITKSHNIIDT